MDKTRVKLTSLVFTAENKRKRVCAERDLAANLPVGNKAATFSTQAVKFVYSFAKSLLLCEE